MVLLSGADALHYEVLGLANLTYNLLSASGLSLNADCAEVPARFQEVGTGDTVLGSVGIALCDAGGPSVRIGMDVASGNVSVTGSDASASAEELVAAAGATLERERHVCSLATMRCAWRREDVNTGTPSFALPEMDSGYTRLRLRLRDPLGDGGGALAIEVTRQAVVQPNVEVECADFAAWRAAADACTLLLKHKAPAASREEWVLLLTMPKRDAHDVFFYSQVDVTPEAAPTRRRQALLHGLLGQRALRPPTAAEIRAGNRATLRRVVNALGDTEDVVEGGGEAPRKASAGLTREEFGTHRSEFGTQGEGAIEGTQRQYVVGGLHSHSFDFSLFNCTWVG